MSIIQKIDEALEAYYDTFEYLKSINSYKTDDNIGKFASFCEENGIDDEDIEYEIENGAEECSLIDFDLDCNNNQLFPFNKPVFDEKKQNLEIFRIIKNMYIDAKSPSIPSSKSNYLFAGQKFVYDDDKNDDNKTQIDDVSLLLFGYIRENENELKLNEYVGGIPRDITLIMIFFYGKKYFIHCSPPNNDEYDYAMEILSPLSMIGIQHRKNKIISLCSARSKKNIIYGSNIIQINNKSITDKTDNKTLDKALIAAKRWTPSYIVFRCKKDNKNKGTHLQFDVSFDIRHKGSKFPYYKFTKNTVHSIFNTVFGEDGNIEIMEIYANKQSFNGTWGCYGVSILIFIDNPNKLYRNYEIFDKVDWIGEILKDKINENLTVRFVEKLESIKSNGINCGWGIDKKRSLYDLCFLLKEEDDDNGRDIFYFIMVDIEKMELFHIEQKRNILNVTQHGHILYSSYNFPPTNHEQNKILSDYKFYSNTDDSF